MWNFFLRIVGGVVAWFIYLILLYRLQPNITISDKVVSTKLGLDDPRSRIKISNQSMQPAIEIFAELHRVRFVPIEGKPSWIVKKIDLVRSDPMLIPPFDPDPATYLHTFIFRTKSGQDIGEILKRERGDILRFRLRASHPWSHFVKIFQKEYSPDDIVEGEFGFGEPSEIIESGNSLEDVGLAV